MTPAYSHSPCCHLPPGSPQTGWETDGVVSHGTGGSESTQSGAVTCPKLGPCLGLSQGSSGRQSTGFCVSSSCSCCVTKGRPPDLAKTSF
jgi:hypothetical protein